MDSCTAGAQIRDMSYQFAHTEVHSRKGGKSGSTSYVLDEAQRLPGACPHVAKPSPPELIWGISIEALRALHDQKCDTCLVTSKNGSVRKIRSTQNTLASVVTSFPEEYSKADPQALREWESRTVAWLKAEYGDSLKTVVRHVDEKHPHLHAYLLDEGPEMRASSLHPGYEAKAAAIAAGEDNKGGDRAYRDAMRKWQDRYWQAVGLPCGLARIGPGGRRLTREQWHKERDAQRAVRTAIRAKSHLKKQADGFVEKTKAEANAVKEAALAEADRIRARASADALRTRGIAHRTLQEAQEVLRRAQAAGSRVAALWTAARGYLSGEKEKVAEAIEHAAEAATAPLKAELSSTKEKLKEERQKSKNLRECLTAATSELGEQRRMLQKLTKDHGPSARGPRPQ